MKLLLASAGIRNASLHDALPELLGKPIADSDALCIPTAGYGHPHGTPGGAWRFVAGQQPRTPMCELGWKSLGLLELTALPQHRPRALGALGTRGRRAAGQRRRCPVPVPLDAPVGLADLLQSLPEIVWVGLSAGSMVMAPQVGEDFIETKPPVIGEDVALGVVDFAIFPHLDHPDLPENTLAAAERWAAGLRCPAYAIDDDTAIKVVDGAVEVVSEGRWKEFAR